MNRKMERGEWQGYLDRLSRGLGAQQAELEVDAVDETAGAVANVEVVDGEGQHHIVKFRSPLALPAP